MDAKDEKSNPPLRKTELMCLQKDHTSVAKDTPKLFIYSYKLHIIY